MELIAILFVGYLLLGALKGRPPPPMPVIEIRIIERRDDRGPDPEPRRGPVHEPEVLARRNAAAR